MDKFAIGLASLSAIGTLYLANEIEKRKEMSKKHKDNILRLKDITKENRWLLGRLLKHLGLKAEKEGWKIIKEENTKGQKL